MRTTPSLALSITDEQPGGPRPKRPQGRLIKPGEHNMSKLGYLAVTAATLALLFLLTEYTIPAAYAWQFKHDCEESGWITDICVESPYFWENVK
jgi:hypothetical protein